MSLRIPLLLLAIALAPRLAVAYIDAAPEKLTLPKLLKEFKLVTVMRVQRIDGAKVLWQAEKTLQGKADQTTVRQQITLNGEVPPELQTLKVGDIAVCFSGDKWRRSLTLANGFWYVCDQDQDGAWWRMSFTEKRYDFNCVYQGGPESLADAVATLLKQGNVAVTCRKKRNQSATHRVKYVLADIEAKTAL